MNEATRIAELLVRDSEYKAAADAINNGVGPEPKVAFTAKGWVDLRTQRSLDYHGGKFYDAITGDRVKL